MFLYVSLLSHDRYQYDSLILSKQTWAYPVNTCNSCCDVKGADVALTSRKNALKQIVIFPLRYFPNCVSTTSTVLITLKVSISFIATLCTYIYIYISIYIYSDWLHKTTDRLCNEHQNTKQKSCSFSIWITVDHCMVHVHSNWVTHKNYTKDTARSCLRPTICPRANRLPSFLNSSLFPSSLLALCAYKNWLSQWLAVDGVSQSV
jgi:hypothetical protein